MALDISTWSLPNFCSYFIVLTGVTSRKAHFLVSVPLSIFKYRLPGLQNWGVLSTHGLCSSLSTAAATDRSYSPHCNIVSEQQLHSSVPYSEPPTAPTSPQTTQKCLRDHRLLSTQGSRLSRSSYLLLCSHASLPSYFCKHSTYFSPSLLTALPTTTIFTSPFILECSSPLSLWIPLYPLTPPPFASFWSLLNCYRNRVFQIWEHT